LADIAAQLREIWSEVLHRDDIRDDSDFFALGGSSIAAVHLAAVAQEHLGIEVDAIEVVLNPLFSDFAAVIAPRVGASN
jgi:acyl carrier protein